MPPDDEYKGCYAATYCFSWGISEPPVKRGLQSAADVRVLEAQIRHCVSAVLQALAVSKNYCKTH